MITRYFMRPIMGSLYRRYFILDGNVVASTQISCPDGVRIDEPLHVRFRHLQPAKPARLEPRTPAPKLCTKCSESKPAHAFSPIGATGRLNSWCRACMNAHHRFRRAA